MDVSLDFSICQQRLNEFLTGTIEENQQELLMLRHIFKFIHKNFHQLDRTVQMDDVLSILHHSLRLELRTKNSVHLGVFVFALLNLYDKDDEGLQRCLQILYQILSTLSKDDTLYLQIGNEVFLRLIEILLSNRSSPNNANILTCLKMYALKFQEIGIISQLWTTIKDSLNSNEIIENSAVLQTLIHFFDEFLEHVSEFKQSTEFTQLVQRLLFSDLHDNRKCAYFLLKKSHLYMEEQLKSRLAGVPHEEAEDTKRKQHFWSVCISNFENLEENQSHLILPSLEQLRNLSSDLTEQIWLNILYRQILRHNNILVRRWILEYLLTNLSYFAMTTETQAQFMQALNDTTLYNVEGYMLPAEPISRFLMCDKSKFLSSFSRIEWKAVPLHYWLTQLISHWKVLNVADVSYEDLINLAGKIRALQNVALRRENIKVFKTLFSKILDKMELVKYVQLIEALYNVSDPFEDIIFFSNKIEQCQDHNLKGSRVFTLRLYNILTNNFPPDAHDFLTLNAVIEDKIELNNWQPGFLRFVLIFHSYSSRTTRKFCQKRYNIDTFDFKCDIPLKDLYCRYFEMLASTKEEENLITEKVTDCYVQSCFSSYVELKNREANIEELLNSGTFETLRRLTELLARHRPFVGVDIFKCFVESLRNHLKNEALCSVICENLIVHCKLNLGNHDLLECANMLYKLDLSNVALFDSVTKNINTEILRSNALIEGALLADPKVGDSRIEESYECKNLLRQAKLRLVRYKYTKLISSITDEKEKKYILNVLFEKIRNINSKRPRYYANSKEHRSMTQILYVVLAILHKTNDDNKTSSELWEFLMEHNNQQNITILYQIAIAKITNFQSLFAKVEKQLKTSTCTPSQELSCIVMLYRCYISNCQHQNIVDLEKLIFLLWPLTMGANFQTRLYAQLAISSLVDEFQAKNSCYWYSKSFPETLSKLGATIKKNLTDVQTSNFKEDIRFMEVNIEDAFGNVMDFTNAPYDEYNFIRYTRFGTKNTAVDQEKESQSNNSNAGNGDVQRKLNPVADFMPVSNLYSYPESKESTLYVVASLIDKIPNLGGIARTCEVLGIKNLVINSKAHTAKPDFKNLSMTAENSLNIEVVKLSMLADFILKKKSEGFKIVGAEQTAKSCSFVNFQFPKRSVLLLGHEKEGIPPNLLGFLDYAVEIPQFGLIRSLNVHVTGALFMWEYCKQHIQRIDFTQCIYENGRQDAPNTQWTVSPPNRWKVNRDPQLTQKLLEKKIEESNMKNDFPIKTAADLAGIINNITDSTSKAYVSCLSSLLRGKLSRTLTQVLSKEVIIT